MSEIYEDPTILAEYLLFHYGSEKEILLEEVSWPSGMRTALDFAVRTPGNFSNKKCQRGLDLGCAVGRSTFEMSRCCERVIGIDFSQSFIRAANQLKEHGTLDYLRRDEAHITTPLRATLPDAIDPAKTTFVQGDAMNLPKDLGEFDRVHAANLLCRLSDPGLLLARFPDLVRSGGQLVLATPCTWLENFTPSDKWPTGNTLDWLISHLSESFDLMKTHDEPFLIRETSRKFQWTRSMLTVWNRL
ncbi:putative 4-mercaptohistidine N1-methyltransferase [Luteolibacter algae]|uniref:4-mercaptohistidine N1-methyltransferase n=1 Tax=Luteolibacter algae TaxID=454151 RepID=A0ABW5D9L3_9BACT